jgi:vacuolar-type H+-ATPase subunit E/Vma4
VSEKTSNILVSEIREQSNKEAEAILQQAEKEAQRITYEAMEAGDTIRSEILLKSDHQAKQTRQRILSKVNLLIQEKIRNANEEFIQDIFHRLQQKLDKVRKSKEYPDILDSLILEGIPVLESDHITLVTGEPERKLLNRKRLLELEKKVTYLFKRKIRFNLSKEILEEGGVILMSDQGRIRFDNRFSSRIQRMESQLRLITVRESKTNQIAQKNNKKK